MGFCQQAARFMEIHTALFVQDRVSQRPSRRAQAIEPGRDGGELTKANAQVGSCRCVEMKK
ncbi:hypothetical protein Dda_6097 [Drechslerella dactyloides]|uniref:Uncharacterized protein n=1 Tax=Drechslerella dactyloides TaxID=74499 RepID=A0AAD6IV43_DREDA|nr:hypothetical protein Dda_6097 [Drechslerella dactyloides]